MDVKINDYYEPDYFKAYVSDKNGIGVDFDEKEALKYPEVEMDHSWLFSKLPDGTPVRP